MQTINYLLELPEFLNESLRYSKGVDQRTVLKIQKEIQESLMPMLRISESSYAFIGSAGKKKKSSDLSYNINVALDVKTLMKENNLELEECNNFIKEELKRLKYSCTEDNGKIIVNWSSKKESAEVRFQLVENLDWIKFSRYSPDLKKNESAYIGKYREAVFSGIARVGKKEVVSYLDSNESVKEYEEFTFVVDEGLCVVTKSFEGKNGILKTPRLLENSKRLLTDDPEEFAKILFGDKFKSEDISTFEKCLKAIESKEFKFAKRRPEIYKKVKQEMVNLRLTIPEGLM